MKRPELIPKNAEDIYKFYDQKIRRMGDESTRFILRAALRLPRAYYKPMVDFPEATRSSVRQAIRRENGVIVASNHRSYEDFGVVAATVGKEKELRGLAGRHFALAKVILFGDKWEGALKNPAVRSVIEGVGGVPVFRKKDMAEGRGDRRPAIDKMTEVSARLIAGGYNMIVFPHGTVYKGEGIGNVETGIGRIAVATQEVSGRPVDIIPMGIYYPDEEHRRHSFVHIGAPYRADNTIEGVIKQTEEHLLEAYKAAQNISK